MTKKYTVRTQNDQNQYSETTTLKAAVADWRKAARLYSQATLYRETERGTEVACRCPDGGTKLHWHEAE